jgi:hypothetical protein
LRLKKAFVVYPGRERFPLARGIEALPAGELPQVV